MNDTEKRIRAALAEKDFAAAKLKRDNLKALLDETASKLSRAQREVEIAATELREAQAAVSATHGDGK